MVDDDVGGRMEFRILGPLEVWDGGRQLTLGSARQRKLLAALLVQAGEVVSTDRLTDVLWADSPPADALSTLQTYVSRLRRVVDAGEASGAVLLSKPPGYVLRVGSSQLDAASFESMVARARVLAQSDPADAVVLLTDALGLWRGPALAEFADDEFVRPLAVRLEGLRLAAIGERNDLRLALGQHSELIGELEALVASHPLDEQPRAQLMLALYRSGRHVEALRAFQDYRSFLGDEMGLEPSASLQDLERRIVRQDPDLAAVTRAAAPSTASQSLRTAVFLCTDIEGSTRLWEEHPDAMREALARHDTILGDAVEQHAGRIFKTTGDGAYATLPAVSDAVAAAVQAMRALSSETWGPIGPLAVRVGIHTGEVDERDGDYFGPALNPRAG